MRSTRKALSFLLVVMMLVLLGPSRIASAEALVSSADVASIRLIEDGWVEILWKNRMAYTLGSNEVLTTRDNYILLLDGEPVPIHRAYYYELISSSTYMTSLEIKDWKDYFNYDDPDGADGLPWLNEGLYTHNHEGHYDEYTGSPVDVGLTLQLKPGVNFEYRTGGTAADTSLVYDVYYEPIYKRQAEILGIRVRTTENANPANFVRCETIVNHMLKKSVEEDLGIHESMARYRMQIVFSGQGENLWFLPEFRYMQTYGATPAGGYGATPTGPTLGLAGGSSVASAATIAHEMGHCVQLLGLAVMPEYKQWMIDYGDMYLDVVDQGMYLGDGTGSNNQFSSTFSYALSNSGEFFAESTSMWFNTFRQRNNMPTSRQSMAIYNPKMYVLLKEIYPEEDLPDGLSSSPSQYSTPFTYRFVENRGANDSGEIGYNFDGNYFSLLSFLNTHVITDKSDPGEPLTTWWDFSHTPYNYNFDGLSWVVTPVQKGSRTYYNFTQKGRNPNNPGQGQGTDPTFGDGTGVPGCFYDEDGKGGLSVGIVDVDDKGQPVVGIVVRDLEDDTQLWSVESWMGRYSQIVNKHYDMALSTDGGIVPADATPLVLVPFALKPEMGAIWRVIQLKPVPVGGTGSSLRNDKYAILPTLRDVKMKQIWIDGDDYINIIWSDRVDNEVASLASNYLVTLGMDEVELDSDDCTSVGNFTRLKLADPPSVALLSGLNAKIRFVGDMINKNTGFPANNQTAYAFRHVDNAFVVFFSDNFGPNDGIAARVDSEGRLTAAPQSPHRSLYGFDGWFTEKTGGTQVDLGQVFSENTTVYAHWTYEGRPSVGETGDVTIPGIDDEPVTPETGDELGQDEPEEFDNPFVDVVPGDWFYDDIAFVYTRGLFLGIDDTEFSPLSPTTRAMLVTVLWRLAGEPESAVVDGFTDLEQDWYLDAVKWAAEHGIVLGSGDNRFEPDTDITREQIVTILFRYAMILGLDTSFDGDDDLGKYSDSADISDYGFEAMQWACSHGIIEGRDDATLAPKGIASRCEVAAVFHRFFENIIQ